MGRVRTRARAGESKNEEGDAEGIGQREVTRAYARWAPIYDLVFRKSFERGHRAADSRHASASAGAFFEAGVGTGLTLPYYSPGSRVFGIDFSEPMLSKARPGVTEAGLAPCRGLGGHGRRGAWNSPTRPSTWWWRNAW